MNIKFERNIFSCIVYNHKRSIKERNKFLTGIITIKNFVNNPSKMYVKKLVNDNVNVLKNRLLIEKNKFEDLEKKIADYMLKFKEKERIRKKKELDFAIRKIRKLSTFAFYLKLNKGKLLTDSVSLWRDLSLKEKYELKKQADEYHEEKVKIHTPKPKSPPSGYAAFVKQNYQTIGKNFIETNKDLAKRWSLLSNEEKKKYFISQTEKQKYKEKYQTWLNHRLKIAQITI